MRIKEQPGSGGSPSDAQTPVLGAPASGKRRRVWVAILGVAVVAVAAALLVPRWLTPSPTTARTVLTAQAKLAAGYGHTCAITANGGVKCWGDNRYGQLGIGSTTNSSVPADVTGLTSDVVAISAGFGHTCAVTKAGGVKCWGANTAGQSGVESVTNTTVPVDVVALSDVVAISAGYGHSCAITRAGGVKCWGDNDRGQLGNGTSTRSLTPVDVGGLADGVVTVSAGNDHTCAVLATGGLKCWGANDHGQLGAGSSAGSATPIDVSGLANGISGVSAGNGATCALTATGKAACWGLVAEDGPATGVVGVSTSNHMCAVTDAGKALCWGYSNLYGQLGNGSIEVSSTPITVSGLTAEVSAIAAGGEHTCARISSGAVTCWGGNDQGQLGNGTTTGSYTPVDVAGL